MRRGAWLGGVDWRRSQPAAARAAAGPFVTCFPPHHPHTATCRALPPAGRCAPPRVCWTVAVARVCRWVAGWAGQLAGWLVRVITCWCLCVGAQRSAEGGGTRCTAREPGAGDGSQDSPIHSPTLADEEGIRRHSTAMNAGGAVPLFVGMLTQRPWEEVTNKQVGGTAGTAAAPAQAGMPPSTLPGRFCLRPWPAPHPAHAPRHRPCPVGHGAPAPQVHGGRAVQDPGLRCPGALKWR